MAEAKFDNTEMVTVGRVLSAHGTSGGLKIQVLSDVPQRFAAGSLLELEGKEFRVRRASPLTPRTLMLHLDGIADRAAALPLVGKELSVPASAAPALPPDEYFHFQLLGLAVHTQQGALLGEITDILETGSNDVYLVTQAGQELLLPAIRSVILSVDLPARRMTVDLPAGLL